MCKNVLPAYSSAKIIFKNQFFTVMITDVAFYEPPCTIHASVADAVVLSTA